MFEMLLKYENNGRRKKTVAIACMQSKRHIRYGVVIELIKRKKEREISQIEAYNQSQSYEIVDSIESFSRNKLSDIYILNKMSRQRSPIPNPTIVLIFTTEFDIFLLLLFSISKNFSYFDCSNEHFSHFSAI